MPRMDSYQPRRSTDLGAMDPFGSEIPPCPDGYAPVLPRTEVQTNEARHAVNRLDMLCSFCGTRALIPTESFDGSCPRCGKVYLMLTCTRCGNTWKRRGPEIPRVCPRCKSPYWCKERAKRRGTGQTPPKPGSHKGDEDR